MDVRFEVRDVIANEHSVAMFGSFTYKTRTLGEGDYLSFRAARESDGRRDQLHPVSEGHVWYRRQLPCSRAHGTSVVSQPAAMSVWAPDCYGTA
jgi:hypothetical protein